MTQRVTPKILWSACRPLDCWGYQWRVLPHWLTLFEQHAPDLHNLDASENATLLKEGAGRAVYRLQVGEHSVVAKVYEAPQAWGRIRAALLAPPGKREFIAALYGLQRKLGVVRPIAYGSTPAGRGGPHILLTEAVTDARPLSRYWMEQADADGRRRRTRDNECITTLARFLDHVHNGGLLPADLHVDNILVTPDREYVLLDLHKARINVPCRHILRMLNLADLHQWFQRHASRTDRLRFLLAYLTFGYTTPGDLLIRRYAREVVDATQWKQERLERKRDKRIFGDNKYFGVLSLPDDWTAHVFLQAKRPLRGSRCATLQFSRSDWTRTLSQLIAEPDTQAPETLRLGDHAIPVRVEGATVAGNALRQRWHDEHRKINRNEALHLPLALLEQRGPAGKTRSLYIVEQG